MLEPCRSRATLPVVNGLFSRLCAIGQAGAADAASPVRAAGGMAWDVWLPLRVAVDPVGDLDEAGPPPRVKPGEADDLLLAEAGDRRDALRWEFGEPIVQLRPADAVSQASSCRPSEKRDVGQPQCQGTVRRPWCEVQLLLCVLLWGRL